MVVVFHHWIKDKYLFTAYQAASDVLSLYGSGVLSQNLFFSVAGVRF